MAISDPSEKKTKQFFLLGIAVFVIILIYAIATQGPMGIKAVLSAIMKILIWIIILVGIAYAVYKIFIEKGEINIVANNKQSIIDAGKLCKPPLMRNLYLTGDKEHGEAKIGHIIGYCQIQSYEKADEGVAEPEDCFVFKTQPFPFSMFEEAKVFRCLPTEHSELIGDVKIYAISPIEKYGYYFPNNTFLNVRRIDQSVIKESYRTLIHETLRDLATISKKASGMDTDQQKLLEQRKLLKIPSSLGEEETRQA